MSFYCVFIRLVLFAASYLILCYLMSFSIVCFSLKCIGIKFNVIWPALYFTNAHVDIILRAFRAVGTDLSPLIATPMSLYLFWFQTIYVGVDLRFGVLCLKCIDGRTQIWPLPHSGLAAAKHWFGSCQTLVWQLPNPSVAAAQLPN